MHGSRWRRTSFTSVNLHNDGKHCTGPLLILSYSFLNIHGLDSLLNSYVFGLTVFLQWKTPIAHKCCITISSQPVDCAEHNVKSSVVCTDPHMKMKCAGLRAECKRGAGEDLEEYRSRCFINRASAMEHALCSSICRGEWLKCNYYARHPQRRVPQILLKTKERWSVFFFFL